ncbi:MAG: metallophosphoesterase [Vicinamibacterales bacterium]
MRFGVLGDIHGDFGSARRIMMRHEDIPFWLCVGDVADDQGRYEPLPAPLHFVKGNNEGFDVLAEGRLPANLHYLPNATLRTVDGIRVAGLGGTFAPSWFETAAAALPHPQKGTQKATELADKRRHFVREEVEACQAMTDVDLFLTHEAPRPYFVGQRGGRGNDAGKTPVNEVLAAMKPRLHVFGHHHRFSERALRGVQSVGLDLVSKSYLIVDAATFEYEAVT